MILDNCEYNFNPETKEKPVNLPKMINWIKLKVYYKK